MRRFIQRVRHRVRWLSYMLEHFEDLANNRKMDASTLRTGIKSELNYVKDRAMMPGSAGAQSGGGGRPAGLAEKYGGVTH